MRRQGHADPGEVLIEVRRIGALVRVAAIDPATGTEVSVPGPAHGDLEALTHVAIRKLSYVLARGDRPDRRPFFA